MIIGVSMRVTGSTTYPEPRDAISQDWIGFLDAMSVTPVPVPNTLRGPASYLQAIQARGLILTGGDDLGPLPGEVDGEVPHSHRDATERALLVDALERGLPVFGVCRGLQLINVCLGGSLVRDLAPLAQHVNVHHSVEVVSPPYHELKDVKRVVTNSYHSQGVVLGGLAPQLRAFAVAEGEVVEGLQSHDRQVLVVQWHPERPNPASDFDRELIRGWLARCE